MAEGREEDDFNNWHAELHAPLDPRVAEARRKVAAGLSNIANLGRG
jgi:hypothetical protein